MCTAVSFGIISQFRGSWPLGWSLLHRWPLWPFARNWTSIEKIEPGSCWRSGFKVEKILWNWLMLSSFLLEFEKWIKVIIGYFWLTETYQCLNFSTAVLHFCTYDFKQKSIENRVWNSNFMVLKNNCFNLKE